MQEPPRAVKAYSLIAQVLRQAGPELRRALMSELRNPIRPRGDLEQRQVKRNPGRAKRERRAAKLPRG